MTIAPWRISAMEVINITSQLNAVGSLIHCRITCAEQECSTIGLKFPDHVYRTDGLKSLVEAEKSPLALLSEIKCRHSLLGDKVHIVIDERLPRRCTLLHSYVRHTFSFDTLQIFCTIRFGKNPTISICHIKAQRRRLSGPIRIQRRRKSVCNLAFQNLQIL